MIKNTCVFACGMGLAGWLATAAGIAAAEEAKPVEEKSGFERFAEQDYLMGDWQGTRTGLSQRGIDFEFFYIATEPWNLSGGIKTGAEYQGALLMALDLDSQKLAGYDGGHLHASSLYLHGADGFSATHIGDLNKVNLVDFANEFRLWELWYEQKFFGDKLSVKLGQMAVDRDFIVPEYYASFAFINFMNQTFFYPTLAFNLYDIPGFPVGYHALASTPSGAPAVRVRVDPIPQVYVQAAVYDGYPDQSSSGTRVNLNSQEGALIYFEIGYRLNQRKEDEGLPGNYKLGGFYHTDSFVEVYPFLTTGIPTYTKGNYGAYFLADQFLYREIGKEDPAQQGLVGFFRVLGAPPDRNLTEFEIDGGLVYRGLIPTRDYDTIGLAGSYLKMSKDIRQAQIDVNAVLPGTYPFLVDYEGVVELSYRAQMTAWCTLQTSLQRPMHPGGSAAIPDAWAIIFTSTIRF